MRKRNIKTVAHWVIMSILLLFPILMVGVSSFANDEQMVSVTETYEYQTNEVNNVNDLVVGNIYKINLIDLSLAFKTDAGDDTLMINIVKNNDISFALNNAVLNDYGSDINSDFISLSFFYNELYYYMLDNNNYFEYYFDDLTIDIFDTYETNYCYCLFKNNNYDSVDLSQYFTISDYLGQVTTDVDIQNATYKQEVNNWCNGFKNLPVNQWYGQLLDLIGVGQTTNSVMNVIYVYPLYVLWVYLLDLIVDCLLVIIHMFHGFLSKLGGDND